MKNAADNTKTKLSHYIFFRFYCVFKFAFSGLFLKIATTSIGSYSLQLILQSYKKYQANLGNLLLSGSQTNHLLAKISTTKGKKWIAKNFRQIQGTFRPCILIGFLCYYMFILHSPTRWPRRIIDWSAGAVNLLLCLQPKTTFH